MAHISRWMQPPESQIVHPTRFGGFFYCPKPMIELYATQLPFGDNWLHASYLPSMIVRCRWDSVHYRNRVIGFYRLRPMDSGCNVKL